jgi:hypothetical protein
VAVDPRRPRVVVVGANDYCSAITTGDAWVGFYRSTDGGRTWTDGLVPGYPTDSSSAGFASPTRGLCSAAADPSMAFDNQGRLFYGFICFDRSEDPGGGEGLVRSSTFVARYGDHGSRYVGTTLVARGTPDRNEDKINLTVDRSGGRFDGRVYAAWVELAEPTDEGVPQDPMLFSRSSDHGATFGRPIPVSTLVHPRFPDLAVGPDGTVYVAFRSGNTLWVGRSTNGGRSFDVPAQVAAGIVPFDSSHFSAGSGEDCGIGPFRCKSGLIFSRFDTQAAVTADESGVHVVWNERVGTGQSKLMVRSSPDGSVWSEPRQIDTVSVGHQYFPDIAAGGGVITVVFQDSRRDPSYSPTLPPGVTRNGKNPGGAVDVFVAQSRDGGATWVERRITTRRSNFNYLVPGLAPFWGDYIYVSAVRRTVHVAWTDSRDLVPEPERRRSFRTYLPCPDEPFINDPCLSQGGSDQNIYSARL